MAKRNLHFVIAAVVALASVLPAGAAPLHEVISNHLRGNGPTLAPPRTKQSAPTPARQVAKPAAKKPVTTVPDAATVVDDEADPNAPIEIVQERYPSGKVKTRREVTQNKGGDYISHGQWAMWDEEGAELASGEFRNNRRVGPWKRVYAGTEAELFSRAPYKDCSGPFTSEATFTDGKLDGKWTIYDKEHHKISEWQFADGLRDGPSVFYYPSGNAMQEMNFKDGLLDGAMRSYDENAQLLDEASYQLGRKVAVKVEKDKEGNKLSEGVYLHASLIVTSPADWWNATPATYARAGEDVLDGRYTAWHPDGRKRVEGSYRMGLPDGKFTWWYPNGQQASEGSYKEGKKDGQWSWWFENGQKSASGEYVNDEMAGIWMLWKENGRLAEKTDYRETDHAIVTAPEVTSDPIATQAKAPGRASDVRFVR